MGKVAMSWKALGSSIGEDDDTVRGKKGENSGAKMYG